MDRKNLTIKDYLSKNQNKDGLGSFEKVKSFEMLSKLKGSQIFKRIYSDLVEGHFRLQDKKINSISQIMSKENSDHEVNDEDYPVEDATNLREMIKIFLEGKEDI